MKLTALRVALCATVALPLLARAADASTIDGWLAECTAVATGSCTENAAAGYNRQPISFNTLGYGSTVSSVPFTFGQGAGGTITGHAIYDAPTGGNLLAVLPYATPYSIPSQGDRGDTGALRFSLSALGAVWNPAAFNGAFGGGIALGTMADGSIVSSGTGLTFTRGVLAAFLGTNDPLPAQPTETTGFSYQTPAGTSSVQIMGAGTLSTGTFILPQTPTPGMIEHLACAVTVTTLTVSPGAGATITGTAPNTCGPAASHELQYYPGTKAWAVLF